MSTSSPYPRLYRLIDIMNAMSCRKPKAASSTSQAKPRPSLFTSSSLTPNPSDADGKEDGDTDVDMGGPSDGSTPGVRRSSRVHVPARPIVPFSLASTSTRKTSGKSDFDKLFAEKNRRIRMRGGVDGFERAGSLARGALESSSESEGGESSDDAGTNAMGSTAGASTSKRSRRAGASAKSRSSRGVSIVPDSGDETASDPGVDPSHAHHRRKHRAAHVDAGVARGVLGTEQAQKLEGIIQADVEGGRKRTVLRLWDKDVKATAVRFISIRVVLFCMLMDFCTSVSVTIRSTVGSSGSKSAYCCSERK